MEKMTVKELKAKYKGYSFELYGQPLKIKQIPYTKLPKGKSIDNCIVKEFKVLDNPFNSFRFNLATKKAKNERFLGIVQAFIE